MSSRSTDSWKEDIDESLALSLMVSKSGTSKDIQVKSGVNTTNVQNPIKWYESSSENRTTMDITVDVLTHPNEVLDRPFPQGRMLSHNDHFNRFCLAGYGAFSVVLKAKHRIDNTEYALKVIPNISTPRQLIATFREVNALTKLINPYIVRYYTCWVEPQIFVGKCSNPGPYDKKGFVDLEKLLQLHSLIPTLYGSEEEIGSSVKSSGDNESTQKVTAPDSSSCSSLILREQRVQCLGSFSYRDPNLLSANPMTLVIQMELCTSTLGDWLASRPPDLTDYKNESGSLYLNPEYRRQVRWLFDQIVLGLIAIHESNIIHRDIKPVNVFIQENGSSRPNDFFFRSGGCGADSKPGCKRKDCYHRLGVKIGDFGLSKILGQSGTGDDQSNGDGEQNILMRATGRDRSSLHTSNIGTIFYVAPEVLAESEDKWSKYNQQADIYSLGVVLLQMLHICKTDMELAHYTRCDPAKPHEKSSLPSYLFEIWPVEAELLFKMLHPNPNERPSASDLRDRLASTSEVITGDINEVRDLRAENEELRKRISELEIR